MNTKSYTIEYLPTNMTELCIHLFSSLLYKTSKQGELSTVERDIFVLAVKTNQKQYQIFYQDFADGH